MIGNWEQSADPKVGSFMPALRWAVENTQGPILELGTGYFSTSYLATLSGRDILSYEWDIAWREAVEQRFPHLKVVSELPEGNFSVVLVDCEGWKRLEFLRALRERTDVFCVHDAQDHWIPEDVLASFRYRKDFDEDPRTSLVSDVVDVTG